MRLEGNRLFASEGLVLRRKGTEFLIGNSIGLAMWDGKPDVPDNFEEVVFISLPYGSIGVYEEECVDVDTLTSALIRQKYSAQEEIALLNKTIVDGISEEYKIYLEWCESAKEAAKMHFEREDNTLAKAKADKIKQLTAYDKSSAVNEFTLFGHPTWLELRKREDMRQSLVSLKAKGFEEFTYWLDTTPITLPIAQFEAILDTVEVYAIQCFNVTAQHKAAILALETIEDVEAYDFTTGYPEKIVV